MLHNIPHGSSDLKDSYAWCRELTQRRAKNFFYAIRILSPARRDAMCAVYAFFRDCDDISDSKEATSRLSSLEEWRRVVNGEEPSRLQPGLLAFRHANSTYKIPSKCYLDLIDGIKMDLDNFKYETFEELYSYCYRVASTVGLVCIHIFGFDGSPETEKMAEFQGIAFQLTNILRDIAEDAEMGRVYIPGELLREFNVTPQDLLSKKKDAHFASLMKHMTQRAERYYELSENLPARINPQSRTCLRAMTYIYHGILQEVKALGPNVLTTRASLTFVQKLFAVAKAYLVTWTEQFTRFLS